MGLYEGPQEVLVGADNYYPFIAGFSGSALPRVSCRTIYLHLVLAEIVQRPCLGLWVPAADMVVCEDRRCNRFQFYIAGLIV